MIVGRPTRGLVTGPEPRHEASIPTLAEGEAPGPPHPVGPGPAFAETVYGQAPVRTGNPGVRDLVRQASLVDLVS